MTQSELFPEFGPSELDQLSQFPEDVQKDLAILMGHNPLGPMPTMGPQGDPLQPNPDHGTPTAQQRFLAEKAKKTEKIKRTVSGARIQVVDLATEQGRADYEKFMSEIIPQAASDPDHWRVTETPHPLVIDPHAPAGYRLIVTLRHYQCDQEVIPGNHGYTVIGANGSNTELQSTA